MVLQEQIYQVGVELVAGPARGENYISIGPDLTGKTFEINPRLLEMLKRIHSEVMELKIHIHILKNLKLHAVHFSCRI